MSGKNFIRFLVVLLMGLGVTVPASADVYFQCPTVQPGGSFSDVNGDGMIRADDGEIVNPVSPTEVCMHLSSGDGFVNMADRVLNPVVNPDEAPFGHSQYVFGFSNVTDVADSLVMETGMVHSNFPAPTITLKEGDEFYLTLTNVGMMMRPDLFDPHTVHFHGFPNASAIFDGVPDDSISINMGSSLTYYYKILDAGTYMYHCHVEAAEHMQMGMLGNLYVEPAQNGSSVSYNGRTYTQFAYDDDDGSTGYDVAYPLQVSSFDPNFHDMHIAVQPLPFAFMTDQYPMINGRGYPDTINTAELANSNDGNLSQKVNSLITATAGQRILLRVSSLITTNFITLTVQGIPMQVVGNGARKLGPLNDDSQYYMTNSISLGGGEAMEVILDTNGPDGTPATADDIAPGTYFLYATNVDHLANNQEDYGGMMTEIVINP
jgi:FtsP/CotA-like multicopper oxidase with cupredoxin domain